MIHRSFNIRLLFLSLTTMLCLSTSANTIFKKKKKTTTEKQDKLQKSAYQLALSDKLTMSSRGDFISLHKTDGKLYIELPQASLGRDMLIGATVSSVSNPKFGDVGFKNSNLVHIRFVERDSSVIMQVVNTDFFYDTNNSAMQISAQRNYDNLDFFSFPIKARNDKDNAVLFDASSFFLKESRYFPAISSTAGSFKVTPNHKEELSYITQLKTFPTNACIKIDRNYLVSLAGSSGTAFSNYPVNVSINFTLALLPKQPMRPRLSDTRIGVFNIEKRVVKEGEIFPAYFARRWRIEPKDTAAYFAGQLTEPIKQIKFYIEPSFPAHYKESVRRGVLRWNKAFERIGFENVVTVDDYPTNDPEFDPDNFQYSCIRYLPSTIENAMGPSWVDPRTGEIVNATVLVYNDVVNTIDNWRFVQTAAVDSTARISHVSDSVKAQTMEYVIAHEIGHVLGFMHNMAGSAAIPTDSLRSASYTQRYGTTMSIMDYARFNYVAQPGDTGVSLTPPFLGDYDYYLVDWNYRVFPNTKTYEDDAKHLHALIEKNAGNPIYRYGLQQTSSRFDPSAWEEDLGDDPVKSSEYGMRNLKLIIANLNQWVENDEDGKRRNELYHEIMYQAFGYIRNVFANVSGIYLTQSSEQSGIPRYRVVPKDKQRASAMWLLKQAREFANLSNAEVEKYLPYAGNRPFQLMARDVQSLALGSTSKLAVSFYMDSTSYSPLEYCEDIYQDVFAKTLKGDELLTETDRSLQNIYVGMLAFPLQDIKQIAKVRNLRSLCGAAQCCEQAAKTQEKQLMGFPNFGKGYGEPEPLWGVTVNRTSEFLLFYAQKLSALLAQRIPLTNDIELKAHYLFLQQKLDKILK